MIANRYPRLYRLVIVTANPTDDWIDLEGNPVTEWVFTTKHNSRSPLNMAPPLGIELGRIDNSFERDSGVALKADTEFDFAAVAPEVANTADTDFSIGNLNRWYEQLVQVNAEQGKRFDITGRVVRIVYGNGDIPGACWNGSSWHLWDGTSWPAGPTPPAGYPHDDCADIVFTGEVQRMQFGRRRIGVKLRGSAQVRDRLIGTPAPATSSGSRDEIIPMVYGDLTDTDAFCPVVAKNNKGKLLQSVMVDSRPVKTVEGLYIIDETTRREYKSQASITQRSGELILTTNVVHEMDHSVEAAVTAPWGDEWLPTIETTEETFSRPSGSGGWGTATFGLKIGEGKFLRNLATDEIIQFAGGGGSALRPPAVPFETGMGSYIDHPIYQGIDYFPSHHPNIARGAQGTDPEQIALGDVLQEIDSGSSQYTIPIYFRADPKAAFIDATASSVVGYLGSLSNTLLPYDAKPRPSALPAIDDPEWFRFGTIESADWPKPGDETVSWTADSSGGQWAVRHAGFAGLTLTFDIPRIDGDVDTLHFRLGAANHGAFIDDPSPVRESAAKIALWWKAGAEAIDVSDYSGQINQVYSMMRSSSTIAPTMDDVRSMQFGATVAIRTILHNSADGYSHTIQGAATILWSYVEGWIKAKVDTKQMFVRLQGRMDGATLIRTPVDVVRDLVENELGDGVTVVDSTGGRRSSWLVDGVLWGKRRSYRDILKQVCAEFCLASWQRADGAEVLGAFDGSSTPTVTIDESDLSLEGNVASWEYDLTDRSDIYTRFEVSFRYNHAKEAYILQHWVDQSGASDGLADLLGAPAVAALQASCLAAKTLIGFDNVWESKLELVRDPLTAAKHLSWQVGRRTRQLALVNLQGTVATLSTVDVGAVVALDFRGLGTLQGASFRVTGRTITGVGVAMALEEL